MGIDKIEISTLTGKLQALANAADDGNGILENKEIEIFKGYADAAVENGQVSEDDYKTIFGSDIKAQKTTNPQKTTYTKKDIERMEDYVVTILKEEVSVTPSEIKAKLGERLGVSANDEMYKDLQGQVNYILNAINTVGYNSKDDVEKLEKTVKEKLQIGRKDDFAKAVLEVLVKNAEIAQRSKEYSEIREAYEGLVKAGKREDAAYKEVRKEYKDKGSYYGDYLKHGSLAYKILHMKRKDSDFEKQTIMPEARVTARKAIGKSEATKSGKVEDDAKATLKAENEYNRYTKKALGGENSFADWISGKDSDMKVARKNMATKNKVEDIREDGLSADEIHKAVDKKSTLGSKLTFGALFKKKTRLFEALKSSGLIVDKGNGEYDVSKLSMIIGEHVGANYKLDRQSSDFKALAEITKTTSALSAATELQNLSQDEAKMLVEMCGYKVEGKNWGKAILSATAGALVTGLSTAASVAANPRPILDSSIINKNHVGVNISCGTEDIANQISKELSIAGGDESKVTTNVIGSTISIIVDQEKIQPILWYSSRHILKSALRAAIPGAALGLIAGLKDSPEKPITSTQFDCTTLEEYEKVLNNEVKQKAIDPKYKDALMMIATTFVTEDKDGNKIWDCEGYKAFLNHAAGNGGILNREELIGALQEAEAKAKKELAAVEQKVQTTQQEEPQQEVVAEEKCPLEKTPGRQDTTLNHKIKFGDSWEELVKAYFPTWKDCFGKMYGKGGAIQALKRAVAANDQEYRKLLAGKIPSSINIPEKLGDCERDDNGKVKFRKPQGAPKGYMGGVGKKTGYDTVTLSDCNNASGTGKTTQEALDALNKKTGKNYTEKDIVE